MAREVKDVTQERSMEAILRTLREAYAREEEQSTTIVYFLCVKCSLPYKTKQVRRSNGIPGTMDCLDCGELVHRWSGIYDFIDWQPVRPCRA
jgi:hypothetical protein